MKKLEQELARMKVANNGDAITALALRVAQIGVEFDRVHMFGFQPNQLVSALEQYAHVKGVLNSKYSDLPYVNFDSAVKRIVPSGYYHLIN